MVSSSHTLHHMAVPYPLPGPTVVLPWPPGLARHRLQACSTASPRLKPPLRGDGEDHVYDMVELAALLSR